MYIGVSDSRIGLMVFLFFCFSQKKKTKKNEPFICWSFWGTLNCFALESFVAEWIKRNCDYNVYLTLSGSSMGY